MADLSPRGLLRCVGDRTGQVLRRWLLKTPENSTAGRGVASLSEANLLSSIGRHTTPHMTLDTARKRWFAHGYDGIPPDWVGGVRDVGCAMRRITETHWEIWVGEGTGLVPLMAGMAISEVLCATSCTWTALRSTPTAAPATARESRVPVPIRSERRPLRPGKKRRRRRQQTCSIELDTLPHEKGARRRLFS